MNIVNTIKKSGAIPVICSPTPYDEYSDKPEFIRKGTDADLKLFCDICKKIAKEKLKTFGGDWWKEVEDNYIEYADRIDELRSNIVKYTLDMML